MGGNLWNRSTTKISLKLDKDLVIPLEEESKTWTTVDVIIKKSSSFISKMAANFPHIKDELSKTLSKKGKIEKKNHNYYSRGFILDYVRGVNNNTISCPTYFHFL